MEKNRIKEKRKNMSDQEREAEKQGAKKRMRKRRLNQTREERQVQNERNKKRMRESRKKNESSEEDSDISCDKDVEGPSDIVKRLNQEYRQNKEDEIISDEDELENDLDCTCEVDVNCPYCTAQNESEKHLYSITSKEESERMEKEELEVYKNMKKIERKEKRKALIEKAKKNTSTITNKRALRI